MRKSPSTSAPENERTPTLEAARAVFEKKPKAPTRGLPATPGIASSSSSPTTSPVRSARGNTFTATETRSFSAGSLSTLKSAQAAEQGNVGVLPKSTSGQSGALHSQYKTPSALGTSAQSPAPASPASNISSPPSAVSKVTIEPTRSLSSPGIHKRLTEREVELQQEKAKLELEKQRIEAEKLKVEQFKAAVKSNLDDLEKKSRELSAQEEASKKLKEEAMRNVVILFNDLVRKGEIEAIKAKLKEGYDPNTSDFGPYSGLTSLHHAVNAGNLAIVRLLITNPLGIKADPAVVDGAGNTPLHLATEQGHEEIIKFFLGCLDIDKELIANPRIKNKPGHKPADCLIAKLNEKTVLLQTYENLKKHEGFKELKNPEEAKVLKEIKTLQELVKLFAEKEKQAEELFEKILKENNESLQKMIKQHQDHLKQLAALPDASEAMRQDAANTRDLVSIAIKGINKTILLPEEKKQIIAPFEKFLIILNQDYSLPAKPKIVQDLRDFQADLSKPKTEAPESIKDKNKPSQIMRGLLNRGRTFSGSSTPKSTSTQVLISDPSVPAPKK